MPRLLFDQCDTGSGHIQEAKGLTFGDSMHDAERQAAVAPESLELRVSGMSDGFGGSTFADIDCQQRALRLASLQLGVPVVAWALASHVGLPVGAALGMVVCMAAPPVGGAGAMAAMLRLNVALAVVGTVAASALAPLFMPAAVAAYGAPGWTIDSLALFERMATLIGGAAVAAVLLRRFASRWIDSHPEALTGASVLGLIVVALGVMDGMQSLFVEHAGAVGQMMLIAFAANVGMQLLGTAVCSPLGWRDAATVGLLSGNRNVTLVAATFAPWLSELPEVRLYIAASVFPIFMLPLALAACGSWFRRPRTAGDGDRLVVEST